MKIFSLAIFMLFPVFARGSVLIHVVAWDTDYLTTDSQPEFQIMSPLAFDWTVNSDENPTWWDSEHITSTGLSVSDGHVYRLILSGDQGVFVDETPDSFSSFEKGMYFMAACWITGLMIRMLRFKKISGGET